MSMQPHAREWIGRLIFVLLALIVPVLVGYEIIDQFRTPAIDVRIDWQTNVIQSIPAGSSAKDAGFKVGDVIRYVVSVPFSEWADFSPRITNFEIQRANQVITLEITTFSLIKDNWPTLLSGVIVALVFWGSGIWLLLRRFERRDIRILFLVGQVFALAFLAPMVNMSYRLANWPIHVSVAALYLSAPLLLHHFLTFPVMVGTLRQRSKVLIPLYILCLAAISGWLWGGFWGRQLGTLYIMAIYLAALSVMGYVYFRIAVADDRRRLRLIVIGTFLSAIPGILFYLLPDVLQLPHRLPLWVVGPFSVIAPLSYLYAILRYNLFGIDRLLNRTLVYLILSLGILVLYIGPYLVIYRSLQVDPLVEILFVVGLSMLIGASFEWTHRRIQRFMDRLFYGGWYDYPGVVEVISATLARCIERQALREALTWQTPTLMQLKEGELWIGNPGEVPPPGDPTYLEWDLSFQGEKRGQWRVAPRRDGEGFSENDRRILKTIASQAETALGNVLLVETLRRQLDDIRRIQHQLLRSREDERARLARDLHDGPLQILVGINMQLGMLISSPVSAPSTPMGTERGTGEVLQPMRTEVRSLLAELRQLCTQLRPPTLDTLGLGASLRALSDEWSSQTGLKTILNLPEDASLRGLSGEVAVNLYRVVQEALSNVARHAEAGQVTLSLSWNARRLELSICDDGKGFTLPRTPDALAAEGHFGLAGMQERVELIGGHLEIESVPGQGTTLRVTWLEQ